ncbi:hypothetical protein [Roseomonas indoligenes]|uniref:Uncharacterized protein n=1 Tax=Roseomonas indoligenes TaxID=2820811 RepID=A0A940MWM1_9PROT|nr:hypothetical protein [Pararoseomonas indoligenes]MBP0493028.1 hypothetical protein [Pararoseomonas indoligenes]
MKPAELREYRVNFLANGLLRIQNGAGVISLSLRAHSISACRPGSGSAEWRDTLNKEDDEELEMALAHARRRLAHAHAFISVLTLAAVAIRHVAAERLIRANDPAPLPEVPVFKDIE